MIRAVWSRLARAVVAIGAVVLLGAQGGSPVDTPSSFDHLATGFALTGGHVGVKCETCHLHAIFKGTPTTCQGCHGAGSRVSSVVIPSAHAPTTQPCEVCHNTRAFNGARWNHADAVPGSCTSCHNGTTATGKPNGHVPTTASCDSCHRTSGWIPAVFNHAGVTAACSSCHNGTTALGKISSHIPTTSGCESCHSSTKTFATWRMNHAGIANNCSTCHGGQFQNVMAKSATHLPTNGPCETCHASEQTFKVANFSHAGIASGCAACHDGTRATGKPATHVPTTLGCETCHSSTTSYATWTMNHAGIANGCAACHDGQFVGVAMKPGTHLPTSAPCETCHAATNFTTWSGTAMNHAGITSGCSTCHAIGSSFFGVTMKTPPANHIPTTKACETCHAPSNYASFAGTPMNHAGITSGCSTCHAVGSSFFGVTMKTPPANHIPFNNAACESCHTASNYTSFGGTPMNHAAVSAIACASCHETGKSWFGVTIVTRPTPAQDAQHPTTGDCGGCHTTSSFSTATAKPANHIPTNQACTLCHSTPGNYTVFAMNHAGIGSGCATCHASGLNFDRGIPRPPPANHLPTTAACETCHAATNFTRWSGTPMNHAGITSGCSTCHAVGSSFFGVTMKTPPANHIPFNNAACESCHTASNYTSFGGTPMNHAAVSAIACASCHETGKSWFGVTIVTRPTPAQDAQHPTTGDCGGCHTTSSFSTATAKPANHIPTNQACTLCHGTPGNYTVFAMNHAGIGSGCATCHASGLNFDRGIPRPPPANHLPTTAACETCHAATNFTTWSGTAMNHAGITSGCSTCHAVGSSFFGVTMKTPPANHIPTTKACETCHAPSNYASFAGTPMNHAGITSGCSTCHAIGSSFFGVTMKTPPANHIPTTKACETCHAPSNYASFAGTPMNHAGITSGCSTCHAVGSSFFGVTMKTPPANHIPFNNAACESCHTASNYTSFGGTPMNHAAVSAIACASCHETGKSWFGVTIVTRPTPAQDAQHPTTGDCGGCHTTSSFSTATAKPANHIPTNQACTLCHSTPGNYTVFAMNHAGIGSGCATCHASGLNFDRGIPRPPPANHLPTTAACETCHAATNFTRWSGTAMNHAGITSGCSTCHAVGSSFFGVTMKTPPANHIPFNNAACESCHTASNYTSFGGTPMNHAAVSAIACASCHETGKSWFGVTIVTRPTPAQDAQHPTTGDCGGCHTTSSFSTATAKPANHIPTNQACTLCHGTPGNYTVFAMNHAGIGSGCATCHASGLNFDRGIPRPPPANHLPTTAACETCHAATNFTTWSGTAMNHAGITSGCSTCHAVGSSFFGVTMKTPPANHIPTTKACETCHAPSNYASFAGTPMNHAGITSGCSTCHAIGSSFFGVTMKTPPANHIPTTKACETCHAPSNYASFAGTPMNHAGITSGCSTCHAVGSSFFGVTMKTPPANHIPFNNAACESCHTASNYTSFGGTPMNHAAVSAIACASCHETGKSWFGVTIVTRPTPAQDAQHPTTGDCGGCHTTSSFSTATAKPANHIPTNQACTLCHSTPGNYTVFAMNHAGIGSGCATCHASGLNFDRGIPRPPPANHLPTTAACETCHAATNFTRWSGTAMNHAGITSGCSTCHAVGSSFFGVTMKTPPANHIPFNNAACESCHTASNYTSFGGTPMNHAAVSAIACASCHETGKSWFGVTIVTRPTPAQDAQHPTTGDCGGCHTTSSFSTATAKPANHIPTNQACTLCHGTPGNYTVFAMNHAGIGSGCATCHASGLNFDRGIPRPPPANHLPTTAACETCHAATNFTTWSGTAMNHAGITSGCSTCHAIGSSFFGVTMKTPPANHIPTTKACETCHAPSNYASFAGTPMNHAGITSGCSTCHAVGSSFFGVTMKTPPANHIPFNNAACESCHTASNYTSFGGTPMNHAAVSAIACASCHETGKSWFGVTIVTRPTPAQDAQHPTTGDCGGCHTTSSFSTATAKPANHIPTNQACTLCHGTPGNYTVFAMNHAGIGSGCATCHASGLNFDRGIPRPPPANHLPTTAACETCHAATNFTTWSGTAMNHAGITSGCSTCHAVGSSFFGVTMKTPPANHIPTTKACETCHAPSNYASFAGTPMNHAGITSGCSTCHAVGSSFFGVTMKTPPANHIPTTKACETCHAPSNYASFAGTPMNHAGITSGCSTCHAVGSSFFSVTMKTPPANHIPFNNAACESCHTASNYTSFGGTPMNHAAVSAIACASCHETGKSWFGVTIVTRPTPAQDAQHPTTGDCGGCHTTSSFSTATAKPANHIPTNQACTLCHGTPGNYTVFAMNHAGIGSGCATCHASGLNFDRGIPRPPPANHLPTTAACETCHAATNFTTWSGTAMNHAGITSGCSTCHAVGSSFFGVTMKTPPANHIPTTKACETCHAPSNYASFAGTPMNHAGITSGCSTCHAVGSSFFGVTMKTPPANHIPFNNAACESCHTASNYTSFGGTPMNHAAVSAIACASCHETGKSWFGVTIVTRPTPAQDAQHPTTGDCGGCHTTSSFSTATAKPANHIPTNQACTLCHGTPGNYTVFAMNHAGIGSGCATCHASGLNFDRGIPRPPPANHLPTTAACETCHAATNFTTWSGTAMNHAGITSGCSTCHAIGSSFFGVTMKTPPANHIPTTKACETCHAPSNYASFAGTPMNHAGITSGCSTCHAVGSSFFGVTMKTPPANHIPFNNAACESCHTASNYTSFGGTPMNHAAVSAIACASCHETGKSWFGVTIVTRPTPAQDAQHPTTGDCGGCHTTSSFSTATAKPANHIPTNQACTLCHGTPGNYTVFAMNHAGIGSGCATCHASGLNFDRGIPRPPPANHLPTTAACETCHAATNFTTWSGTAMNHAGITSGCSTCHAVGSSFFGVTMKTPPANHIPTTKACETCHAPSNYASFAGTPMNHAGITSGCSTCHAVGSSFFGVTMKTPPANHIPFNNAACESCHTASNYTSFGGTPMNHAAVSAIACASCHETGKSWFGVTIVTRPTPAQDAQHPTTGDCGGCHTTSSFSTATAKPANHIPTNQACTLCHGTPGNYTVFAMNHAGIGSGCATCHASGLNFDRGIPRPPPANHLPTTAACETCHAATNFTTWSGTAMNHAGITSGCSTCHAIGSSFFGVTMKTPPANHIPTTKACETCHAPSNYASFAGTPMNHAGITSGCSTCHAVGSSFFGVTMKTPPANHIPFNNAACESCHTASNYTSFGGTPMNHAAVSAIACASCHETGKSWFGVTIVTRPTPAQDAQHPTTGDCGGCHTTSSFSTATAKPANHIPTNQACTLCHGTPGNYTVFAMNHAGIGSGCATCHASGLNFDRGIPRPPPANHLPTTAACETCHAATNFTTWSGTAMNHAGITSGCSTCHAIGSSFFGVTMKTPPANHIPTTKACETCHAPSNYASFAGTPMNHAGITSGCSTCHAVGSSFFGVTMKTPPANHIPFNNAACESCHTASNYTSFGGTPMNHAAVSAIACASCHETGKSWFGVTIVTRPTPAQDAQHPTTGDCGGCHTTSSFSTATAKPANHIPTNQACTLCHGTPGNYTVFAMNHAGIGSGCATCHASGLNFDRGIPRPPPANHLPTTAACETCHAATNFTTWSGTAMNHAGITSGCSTCHAIGSSFFGVTMKTPPANHIPTTKACETCHAPSNYASFAGTPMNHAGITSGCSTCHAVGSSFFGVTMKTPPANHIPFNNAACESCHTASNYTSFGGTPMNHAAVSAIACASCHETGKSWFGVTIVTRPTPAQDAQHPTTGDCGGCHTTSSFSTATAKPANHIPTNQACTLCHGTPGNYTVFAMNHAGIGSGCATCHASGLNFDRGIPRPPPANHLPTTAACETCHAATNFTTWSGTAMNHAGITSGCSTCHAVGSSFFGVTMKTPPANHIPTTKACETCHAPSNYASFAGTPMNHAGITSGCSTCHAVGSSFFGVTMKTPPANHIPFNNAACESCHTASNYTSFGGTPMNHAAVSAIACASCHETGKSWFGVTIVTRPTPAQDAQHPTTGDCGGCHTTSSFSTATAKPANHIPTNQACTLCHGTPGNYTVFAMNHAGIGSGCATCHASGLNFDRGIPRPPPANHLPTTAACETCHAATNFTTWSGTAMNHAGITSGCSTCHAIGSSFFGVTMKTPPANHIPTTKACETCHAPSNYASFAGTPMNHAGITSGCSTCHAVGSSFFGVTMKTPPANHIPFNNAACESCHTASNYTSFGGTPMNHAAVSAIACASCHETGKSWFGVTIVTRPTPAQDAQHPTTGDCGGCHTTSSFSTATAKPANHIPTNQACTLCHGTPGNYTVFAMNHAGIGSGCATCHASGLNFDRGIPRPPPANHLPTTAACETCHAATNFTTWSGTAMNHAGITSGCSTCHAVGSSFFGVTMKTPPANHIPTTKACETCHAPSNYASFAGTPMNHAGITSGCSTCHAVGSSFFGVTMKTPPANHIPFNNAACESCHTASNYTSFGGTPMNHAAVSAIACASCHETGKSWFGVTIVTRPTPAQDAQHPTTGDCGGCHTTSSFSTATAKPANHIPTNQACTLCHGTPGNYTVFAMNHAGIGSGCATCHASGLNFDRGIPRPPPANHLPTTAACETCHAATNFTTWSGTAMNHAGITSGCSTCHAIGSSFFGVTMKTPPANHIPTTKACETCHAPSNYASFAGTPMNHAGITSGCSTCHAVGSSFFGVTMKTPPANHIPFNNAACESCHTASNYTSFGGTPMNHAAVSAIACASCHETGKSWFGVTIVTRPTPAQDAQHPTTGDCGGCHTTSSFSTATAKPANHIPTNQACTLCHGTPGNYTVFAMNHAGIGSGCATCHASGLNFDRGIPRPPPANHLPTTAACETCHAATNFTTWSGTAMNHAGITSGCSTCHAIGSSFFGVTMKTPPANHIPTTKACETCHAPSNYASFAGTPMNHAGITSGCSTCHAVGSSFFGVTMKTPPANHIPTTKACETCHAPSNYASFAGTPMNHAGIVSGCASCHGAGMSWFGVTIVVPPSGATPHIPFANAPCESCHASSNFTTFRVTARAAMNHAVVAALPCLTCHEYGLRNHWFGFQIVTRPSPNHHATQDCGASGCHSTSSFDKLAIARPVTGGAPGPNAPTTPTPPAPDSKPLVRHAGVAPGACASCHNGTTASGKPGKHIATVLSCDSCHRTTAWVPATFAHAGVAPGTCSTCHNGVAASGKAASHFATVRTCDSCHTTATWHARAAYRHLSPLYAPHSQAVRCVECHVGNSETVLYRFPAKKTDCGGCHIDRSRPDLRTKPNIKPKTP